MVSLWYLDVLLDGKGERRHIVLNKVVLVNICCVVSDPTSYNTTRAVRRHCSNQCFPQVCRIVRNRREMLRVFFPTVISLKTSDCYKFVTDLSAIKSLIYLDNVIML